uniref:beta-fructofuranosidase n=1 Tax=uncultured bacterium Contig115 TaxID=1393383 RepID=W0FNJ2_9BACT|nr:beta-fructosidases (levanase/invertase) [uncultured bacterium Contig115]
MLWPAGALPQKRSVAAAHLALKDYLRVDGNDLCRGASAPCAPGKYVLLYSKRKITMSQTLRDARRYEEEKERLIPPQDRPAFHLSARVGWMNDPNGFGYHDGQYHLFYQYHPYDSHWGPMHWGHAVSADLLHWRYLPAALAPDMPYDREGCFSGSAVTLPDGRHLLMYTGVAEEAGPGGELRKVQIQNLAFGDGVNYRKFEGNPVITAADLPEGGSHYDFRDPKLWACPEGGYRCLLANDHREGGGRMLLYRSDDLAHWTLERVVAANDGRLGLMWECPDLFELDGWSVLLASAQDMLPKGFEYHNGNGTFCLLGHKNAQGDYTWAVDHAIDYGIDFYAPQTVLTPDGRRVMIGWMQNWDTCNLHVKSTPWFGQMSLPRELSVKGGRLFQKPLRELEQYRGEPVEYRNVAIENGELALAGIRGRMVDMEIGIEPAEGELFNRFAVRFAKDETFHTGFSFRPRESVVKVDRKFSGSRRAIIHQRRAKVDHDGGRLKLRLILDRFSVEAFINDGEKVMSATIATDPRADGISFFCDGKARFSVKAWTLKV